MIGSKLGPYEVTGRLGEGGMGEVYRATDSRLKREVAIKVLPELFGQDPERLARFEREAQLLAQLHHTNIASIFGVEESAGVRALVMELVEGPTLAERIQSGPLPLEEALSIAKQVAEALEEAHEKGIVHRDLKPQNIKAPQGGVVKVLDFGLAKALDTGASSAPGDPSRSPALMNSPTVTSLNKTQLGMIVGTAAYMSPEQARGGAVDRRVDIWAFGVVLVEMLTGRALFAGDTVTDTLAAVLRHEIDLAELPASTPPSVRRLISRCLERQPRERLRDIGEARWILERALRGEADEAAAATPITTARSSKLPWLVAASLALALALLTWRHVTTEPSAEPRLTYYGISGPAGRFFKRSQSPLIDIAADGESFIFEASGADRTEIMRRRVDRLESMPIAGSSDAENPSLSPDGRWVAYFSAGSLCKLSSEGGTPLTLATARAPRGLAWTSDGSLIYSPLFGAPLFKVSANGGAPVELTKLDSARGERSHRWPQLLPDGKGVLFTVGELSKPGDYDDARIDLLRLESGIRQTLMEGARMARYSSGYLLFQRRDTLQAARFDLGAMRVASDPFTIAQGVAGDSSSGSGYFAVNSGGTLVYVPETSITNERVLTLVDRDGKETELAAPPAPFSAPRFSPDGKLLAYSIGSGSAGDDDVYVFDLSTNQQQRITFGQGHGHAIWSRDGKRLYYAKGRSGDIGFGSRAADGSGSEVTEKASALEIGMSLPDAWVPGANKFVATSTSGTLELKIFDLEKKSWETLFSTPSASVYAPSFSPDGRFIAYTSTETGPEQVFVESYPLGSGKWQISTESGAMPVWSHDGKELFFVTEGAVWAVDVTPGAVFKVGTPHKLFSGPYELRTSPQRFYDVAPDGRFVVVKLKAFSGKPAEMIVVQGWQSLDPARVRKR